MSKSGGVIRYDDPSKLPAQWQMDENGMEALRIANVMNSTHNGLYTSIPIICKGNHCPYIDTCGIKASGMDVQTLKGQRCPVEISDVMKKFQWYISHLEVEPENIVDLGMIKELVDIDIMLERASRRMAAEADFVELVVVGMSDDGDAIMRPEIRKSVDFKERMQKRKDSLLTLLNSTRKDKAGSKVSIEMDPSSYAAMLLEKKKQLETMQDNSGIINVTDFKTVGEEDAE